MPAENKTKSNSFEKDENYQFTIVIILEDGSF